MILSKKEIRKIEEKLNKTYGCKLNLSGFVVLITSKEKKIWIASKDVFKKDLKKLRINSIGLYFGRFDKNKIRLSIEGAQIVGKDAKRNVCEIEDFWSFIRGFDVKPKKKIKCSDEYVIVKYKGDVLGIGKLKNDTLKNILPKSRRIISLAPVAQR